VQPLTLLGRLLLLVPLHLHLLLLLPLFTPMVPQ
jgi:hypothetical protein